jgi:glycosyltransferase involved in cell wall biosynthesis
MRGPLIIDALPARYGGTAYAAVQLAEHLADGSAAEIIILTRAGSLVARGIHPSSGLRVIELRPRKRLELAQRTSWQASGFPDLVRQTRASSVLTWSGMLPRRLEARVVCYLANPVMFERGGAANALRRWAVRRTARTAAHVLAPSHAMAALVERTVGTPTEVVPFGVDHARFRPAPGPGKDLLCVADFYRHKRHDVLLEAWAALPEPRPRLRLIGDPRVDPPRYRELALRATELHSLGEISFESGLPFEKLVGAYHNARVFALPSEHESFCLPLLEAQACGVAAVVRDLPALRETGGAGTAYVGGDDPAAWAAELERLIVDDDARAAAREKGLEHAQRFSWERTAAAVRARLAGVGDAAP